MNGTRFEGESGVEKREREAKMDHGDASVSKGYI